MQINSLYRFPVKGLSPEKMDRARVTEGNPFPWDRAFAIENGPSGFDPAAPEHLSKMRFLMLARDEKLATLTTRFDPATGMLDIERGGKRVAGGDITTPLGRTLVEQFFAAFMAEALKGPPRILMSNQQGEGRHAFTDIAARDVSIINLASVRDLERITGKSVDPLRFRGNIYIDGLEPWAELSLVGRVIEVDGGVTLSVNKRIGRCPATNVDPQTGERDMAIPPAINEAFGHRDCGIYARVTTDGTIETGATLQLRPL